MTEATFRGISSVAEEIAAGEYRCAKGRRHLERRQPEGVATVLHPKDAEEEAVHGKHDTTPDEDHHGLHLGVGDSGDFEGEGDGRKGENAVCDDCIRKMFLNGDRSRIKDSHMAATI